ncbi:helix-turn-helix domain-containing protein [Rhodococcus sp. USK10]|uniref:helix-turn-helix domain-containing protein n=1 Tax=Rhodococcus sp. USK10 TaxID=2789739 RepID=UPI001C60456D|nr:helix-turn-helix domain-containing protein [Rhodococcus sp. USK10]QYB05413.1 helix-turn-helix domain-containing protein [Rhodococcus sp. USK10]
MALISAREAGSRTGYTAVTIKKKIREGVLPGVKRGNRYFVDERDLTKLYEPVSRTPLYVDMRAALDV